MRIPGLRALVVEADASNAKLLVVLLRAEGADARSASSAESALSLLPYFRPQLIITEAVLPGMGGLEFAGQLRTLDPTITIVIVSSRNGPEAAAEARRAGVQGYFQKPIDTDDFVARLEQILIAEGKKE